MIGPVSFISNPNTKSDASSSRDVSISNISFLNSLGELAKAKNMVVADSAKQAELNFVKNKDNWITDLGTTEETEEEKIYGILAKIKNILVCGNEKEKGGE